MTARRPLKKLTEDAMREILLAGPHISTAELARTYGVCYDRVRVVRQRQSFRALRLARELGLMPLSPRTTVWSGRSGATKTVPASRARKYAGALEPCMRGR